MVTNPFIELAQDPVGSLAWVGYVLFLLGLIGLSTSWSLRTMGKLYTQYQKKSHTPVWWSGPFDIGIVPPPKWTATACAVLFVWGATFLAGSALVWMVG